MRQSGTKKESGAVIEAVEKLANAVEILAERTVHLLGDADATALMLLAAEARKAVGGEQAE